MPESHTSPDQFGLPESDIPTPTDEWDAGYMGCGEVIILLRLRMGKLARRRRS